MFRTTHGSKENNKYQLLDFKVPLFGLFSLVLNAQHLLVTVWVGTCSVINAILEWWQNLMQYYRLIIPTLTSSLFVSLFVRKLTCCILVEGEERNHCQNFKLLYREHMYRHSQGHEIATPHCWKSFPSAVSKFMLYKAARAERAK